MPSATAPTRARAANVFVARQPILDRSGRVFAYELRHRPAEPPGEADDASREAATAHVLTDGVLAIGFEALTDRRRAFVDVSPQMIIAGLPSSLPHGRLVCELGRDATADPALLAACETLKALGGAIAVDEEAARHPALLAIAAFVTVDFGAAATRADRHRALPSGLPAHAAGVALGIRTGEMLAQAIEEGFTYFNGPHLGRPVIKEGRSVPPQHASQLRLLAALNDPRLSAQQLEALIKPDAALCYRILRAVNSAGAGLRRTVSSIGEALVLLGRDAIRRWASLWALTSLGGETHVELLAMATVRARCCELVAAATGRDGAGAEAFLAGVCSVLDVLLGRPMPDVIRDLPLPAPVADALVGQDNACRRVLDAVIAYEWGDWDRASEAADAAGIDASRVAQAYMDSLSWAYELRRT